jgi:hypothetical protein
MKKTYTQSHDEVLRDLGVGPEGLTSEQAQERLAKYGRQGASHPSQCDP